MGLRSAGPCSKFGEDGMAGVSTEAEINMRILRMLVVLGVVSCAFAGAARAQIVRCSSDDGRKQFCQADTRYGGTMVKQVSGAPCQQGRSWGYNDRGIWWTTVAGRSLR